MYKKTKSLTCILVTAVVASATAQVAQDEDPVTISPQYYNVVFENEQVRVLEYRLPPGESEPMHSHPRGVVRYLSDATFLTTLPDGSTSEASVREGDVQWREYTRHAASNIGTTDALAFAVEIKDSSGGQ